MKMGETFECIFLSRIIRWNTYFNLENTYLTTAPQHRSWAENWACVLLSNLGGFIGEILPPRVLTNWELWLLSLEFATTSEDSIGKQNKPVVKRGYCQVLNQWQAEMNTKTYLFQWVCEFSINPWYRTVLNSFEPDP